MESPPKNAADVGFFVGFFATITEPQAVLMPVTFAFVIRLYLSFTSYYISGEAGFIFLMTGAVWLFLTTLRNGRIGIALGARAVPVLAISTARKESAYLSSAPPSYRRPR